MPPQEIDALIKAGVKAGFRGFGGYANSLHFDVGPQRTWGPNWKSDTTPEYLKSALAGANFLDINYATPASSSKPSAAASGADDTMAALGKGGGTVTPDQIAQQAQMQSQGQQPEQPRGLLGNFFGDPDRMAALAMALNSMRLDPDPNLSAVLSAQMKERRGERKETAELNKTLAYLEKQAIAGDARAAEALDYAKGTGDVTGALKIATTAADDDRTALQKNYEYAISQGMTPEQARAWVSSGTTVNVGDKSETEMQKVIGKGVGEQAVALQQAGSIAQRNMASYGILGDILQNAPQGGRGAFVAAAANLGIKFDGASDAEAAQAIINQLVPQQRQPGSGPMSDADLELFKRSLPRLVNTPEGNRLILQTLNNISQYDIQRAMIAQDLMTNRITVPEYFDKLNALQNPLEMFRSQSEQAAPTMGRDEAMKILMGN
jgi:hypothetical protein